MRQSSVPLLSDLLERVERRFSRRTFLAGLPVAAAAAAACNPRAGRQQAPGADQQPDAGSFNSSSRLDTAIVGDHDPLTSANVDPATIPYRRYDPELPPPSDQRTHQVHWRAQEVPVRVSNNMVVAAWTFEGDVPGPILRVRQGDTVEFTLTNEGEVAHSMDFHAAQVDPKVAFRSVAKGQSVSFTFQPKYAGAFMYHCGTAPVLMHIGTGMYGALIVDPPEPLPEAREFVLVQSEYYLGENTGGIVPLDYRKMMATLPDMVVFNGRPDQYVREPLTVNVGDRVRFYVVSAGPTHPCAFHVVGEQFDTVWLGAPPNNPLTGVQTFNVPAGGGMVFEMIADVPGE
ncbi:MAG TPA: multicopper oxidase domain-containing protein, partial [Longimicrobiales bacterium]|nr:multicopper oxidase domain-containing protein [Longimicrobiales bacterium]